MEPGRAIYLVDIQICGNLIVVTGVGSVITYIVLGNHVHLQEGAENIGVVIENSLLEFDSQLTALCGVELGGQLFNHCADFLVLISAKVVAHSGQTTGGEEILWIAGGGCHQSGGVNVPAGHVGKELPAVCSAVDVHIDAAYGMAYEAYPNFENGEYQFSSIQTSRAFFGSMNMTSPIIQDAAVRKAIAMGINKEGFVATLLDGHGVPGNGAFPNGFSTFGGEKVTTETYDPEGAKAVLEAAGWVDTDGDGIREKNGTKLTIRWLTYPSRQELPLLAESAQASLKEIGMDVDINCTANRREFLKDMTSWDIYASALVTAPSGDPQYFFTTSCLPGMSYNFGAYENEEVSAMIEELSTEFDTAKRGEMAVKLQQAILDDNAYVFCSFLQMNMISKVGVTGYTAHACDYYQVTADLDIN